MGNIIEQFKVTKQFKTRVKKLISLYLLTDITYDEDNVKCVKELKKYYLVTNKVIKDLFPGVNLASNQGWIEVMEALEKRIQEIELEREAQRIVKEREEQRCHEEAVKMMKINVANYNADLKKIENICRLNNLTLKLERRNVWKVCYKRYGYDSEIGMIHYMITRCRFTFILNGEEWIPSFPSVEEGMKKFTKYVKNALKNQREIA